MSDLEEEFALQLRLAKIPFLREVRAITGRKFKWDFQVKSLLIEVQGGTSHRPVKVKGVWFIPASGHNSMAGIKRDCEKLNLATLNGYAVMQFTSEHIKTGQALKWVQKYIDLHERC